MSFLELSVYMLSAIGCMWFLIWLLMQDQNTWGSKKGSYYWWVAVSGLFALLPIGNTLVCLWGFKVFVIDGPINKLK